MKEEFKLSELNRKIMIIGIIVICIVAICLGVYIQWFKKESIEELRKQSEIRMEKAEENNKEDNILESKFNDIFSNTIKENMSRVTIST